MIKEDDLTAFLVYDNFPALKTFVLDCSVWGFCSRIGSSKPELLNDAYDQWVGSFPVCSKNSADFVSLPISPHFYTY